MRVESAPLPSVDADGLQRRAVQGSVLSLVNQIIKLIAHVATLLVAAWYVDKEAFGVFALAFSLHAILSILRDCGLANALVQRRDLDDSHTNSVFWFMLTASLSLALALVILAPMLAAFYEKPAFARVVWLMAIPIVAQALGSVQEALLRRDVQFARLLLADAGGVVLASVIAIVAVAMGAGLWGLLLRLIAAPIFLAAICWYSSFWRPRWMFSWQSLRKLWDFGFFFFLTALLGYGMTQMDSPILGRSLGVAAAGVFFMARSVALTPFQELVSSVGRVMFPVFSVVQDDAATLRSGYLSGTRCLATVVFPMIAMMIALAPAAVELILAPDWLRLVPLIQIIALQGVLQCLNNPASQILYARGRSRIQFAYASVIGVFVVLSFVVGSRWGVVGVAICWTAVRFTFAPIVLFIAAREIDMRMSRALANVGPALLCALGAGIASWATLQAWSAAGFAWSAAALLAAVLAGGLVHLGLAWIFMYETLLKIRRDLIGAMWSRRTAAEE